MPCKAMALKTSRHLYQTPCRHAHRPSHFCVNSHPAWRPSHFAIRTPRSISCARSPRNPIPLRPAHRRRDRHQLHRHHFRVHLVGRPPEYPCRNGFCVDSLQAPGDNNNIRFAGAGVDDHVGNATAFDCERNYGRV
jgi:hypothetical protein